MAIFLLLMLIIHHIYYITLWVTFRK